MALRPTSPSSRRAWIEIAPGCCRHGARRVALLAEGVDRNLPPLLDLAQQLLSPSSRRAWIEICGQVEKSQTPRVALLAEGVDRN